MLTSIYKVPKCVSLEENKEIDEILRNYSKNDSEEVTRLIEQSMKNIKQVCFILFLSMYHFKVLNKSLTKLEFIRVRTRIKASSMKYYCFNDLRKVLIVTLINQKNLYNHIKIQKEFFSYF